MRTEPATLSAQDRMKFIPYRGKKLFSLDFSNMSVEEVDALIAIARIAIDAQPAKSLLIFSNFTNTPATPSVVLALRNFAKENTPFVKASASIGLSGSRALILNTINRFTQRSVRIFDDPVRAKNWLIEQ